MVDRSRRWGSDLKTQAPAARSRVENHVGSDETRFFDKLHQEIHTRSSKSEFQEGVLDLLISKANLSDNEKWIINIRASDVKLSRCINRENSNYKNKDLTLSTCQELEDEKPIEKQKTVPSCTCHFVELTFLEIAKKYGGKADTYEKRFKRAIKKLKVVAEEI